MTVPSHPWASVIVPIKDERDNLVPLIEGLLTVMNSHAASQTRPFEIILVDDGSSDGSGEELDRLTAQHPEVTTLHFDQNYGKTCALDAGFRQSSGELIIGIDGDLQQDSEDILKLLPYTATYDLVCGPTRCPVIVGNLLVYRDNSHLSTPYVQWVAPELTARLGAPWVAAESDG